MPTPESTEIAVRSQSWLRLVILAAAAANIASLLSVLYVGRIHPVRYHLVLPSDAGITTVFGAGSIMAAVLLIVGLWIVTHPRSRRIDTGNRTNVSAEGCRAWIPAAVAPVWCVVFVQHPRVNLLIVFGGILLTAWAVARFVRAVLGGVAPSFAQEIRIEKREERAARWWREGWFIFVAVLAIGFTVFHTYVQIRLHRSLQYGSPDIGYYAEILTNALRGRGLRCEAYGHDFFGEHFSPGLYLLVPVWAFWPHIETLMFLGAGAVSSGALAIYALMRSHVVSARIAAVVAVAYLLYPSSSRIIYGASYGFHEILLAIPLMLWSFYHYHRQQWWRMALFAALALSLKENAAVVYGCFGLYVFARNSRDWWGLLLLTACAAYLVLSVGWIVPSFRVDDAYSKYYLYEGLGGTPGNILTSFVREPSRVINRLCSWQAFSYALSLCVPVGMILLRKPVVLVAVPTLAFTCLMDNPAFASIRFWHQSSALPVLWLATVEAVARPGRNGMRSPRLAAAVLCCAALTHYGLGFSPMSRTWRDFSLQTEDRSVLIDRLHEMIPESDSVQATPRLACHFYNQQHVYPLHVEPPQPPGWVVIDTQDTFVSPDDRATLERLRDVLLSNDSYDLVLHDGSVHVFRQRTGA